MISKCWIILSATIFLLVTSALAVDAPSTPSLPSNQWDANVTLRSSIYLPTPRPVADVYVELDNTTPNLVYRVERNQTEDSMILEKMAYATTNATSHDPYKLTLDPLGPFPKGAPMGFTLGEWLAAIGTGTYTEENGNASINLSFGNLVPDGTYSVWCHRVTSPPNYKEDNIPLGASDGSQNMFKADARGLGTFNLKMTALPATTNVSFNDWVAMYVTKKTPITRDITWTLIGVIYHSDGQTHGASPGEFGKNAHMQLVQLMYPKPARTYDEWRNATLAAMTTAENATTKSQQTMPGFEGVIAITVLLAITYLGPGRGR